MNSDEVMPAGAPLRALLDVTARRGPLILTNHPWPAVDVRWVSYVGGEGL
jgi:hypothetical protein